MKNVDKTKRKNVEHHPIHVPRVFFSMLPFG